MNARGLANTSKRSTVFSWLKSKGAGIFLIQESHSTPSLERKWQDEWQGKILFSHGESRSRGVMILITKDVPININLVEHDSHGRLLLLSCQVNDLKLVLVNLYAPTADKSADQKSFGELVNLKLEGYTGQNIIIGGDLNTRFDDIDTTRTHDLDKSYNGLITKLMHNLNIVDIWRLRHPDTKRYTRREKTRFGFSQSRIDYFLASCQLEYVIVSTDILPSIKSDHSLLRLSVLLNKEQPRGKGLWKFNTSLLYDPVYVTLIKETIKRSIDDCSNLSDKTISWDFIKCRVRSETISYCINKSKATKKDLETLSKRLEYLEVLLSNDATHNSTDEYTRIKKEIEDKYYEIAQGHMVRSRVTHIEEFEKPTKYFLNLEKLSQEIKHIRSLKVGCKFVYDPEEILNEQKLFYSKLYTENSNTILPKCDEFLQKLDESIPKLSMDTKNFCDSDLTFKEITSAVSSLANNKSPGPDGLPAEFYKFFWTDIGQIVAKTYFNAFKNGSLIGSQNHGIISIIPKKDKDLTQLSSWRPLSLLNTDYKIIAKVLSNRLKKALLEVINADQIGYMENRQCAENTRLIADIIDFSQLNKHPCIILLIDFEKAFDNVRWSFLKKVLKHFGFGPSFQKWISVLYAKSESCVTNNGYLSSYFKLSRGIRQGCPISAMLFLLVAEIAAILIRKSNDVKGIVVKGEVIKLCQLADDTTLFLTDQQSVKSALEIFDDFHKYSGLKLNKPKTVAFTVKGSDLCLEDCNMGITCSDKPFKTLGVWFSNDNEEMLRLNTSNKISLITSILNSWCSRRLSLKGKITVIKSLVLPHIYSLSSVISMSQNTIKMLDRKVYDFLWSNKKHLVSKSTMQLPVGLGGLKMVSIKSICNTAHIMFVKRLCNNLNAKWKMMAECLMGLTREKIFVKGTALNFEKSEIQIL